MSASVPGTARFGEFEIVAAERRLQVAGQPVVLGSRAFDLLVTLAERRERVVSKEELIQAVWPGLVVEDNNLQVQISALRKVLGVHAIATVPGRGYQLTVAAAHVPAAAPAASALPVPVADDAVRSSRLLVVDDNKVNRLMLSRALQLMGHEVASADNGRSALEKLRSERFDLLLLDLKMPEMDGFDLLERRATEPTMHDVPVIVTSSVEGVAEVARCIELGADDFLHKPVNPMLLKARVDSSLERKFLRDRQRALLARLGPDAATGPEVNAVGRCTDATVLAVRLVDGDASPMAQRIEETLELLGTWSTLMVDAIDSHDGRVDQITGDGIVAVFGLADPVRGDGAAPWAALQSAHEMAALAAQFNGERAAMGTARVSIHIGIASGETIAGYVGTPRRNRYVCIGPAVQRAARLAQQAAASAQPVLIDAATHAALSARSEQFSADALPPVAADDEVRRD